MYQLPKAFRWASLDAPELAERVQSRTAIEAARAASSASRVALLGFMGSGKTSLAIAIGRAAMASRDVNGMFATSLALDKARRETAIGRGDPEIIARAIEVPVLVLDELGAEEQASTALALVIHERHAAGRQTIVTLAQPSEVIRRMYSDGIVRRIYEGALVIRCDRNEQPTPKREVHRMRFAPPWVPPAPRAPRVPVVATKPESLATALERVGNPIAVDAELAERQSVLRAQAAELVRAEFRAKAHAWLNRGASA